MKPMADPRLARAIPVVARGLGKVGRDRARANDITPQQADALELIEARGMVSTGSFAELLGIDPSTASRNLAGLLRAGLVAQRRDAEDGRQTEVRLTPKGKRMAESLAAETLRAFGALLDRVPRAERQRVIEALDVLGRATTLSKRTAATTTCTPRFGTA
jgi:DNA-binding MarR family transcriptional regulator